MKRILISDNLEEEGINRLKEETKVDVRVGLSENELVKIIGNYDGLIVRSATKVTKKIIDSSSLKVIGRAGIGVDNVDVTAATARGIIVVNTPTSSVVSTAEHSIAMMLSLARKIPSANNSVKEGNWKKSKYTGVEIRNKTLGIMGLGKIGSEVAKIAIKMGMVVIAYDPYVSLEYAGRVGVLLVKKEELLKKSDFITIHSALTKESRNSIGTSEINAMKKGVRVINCARGGIIDETALYNGIKSGKIAGVSLDVFEKEPPEKNNPLLSLDEVIVTPHIASSTYEAQRSVAIEIANQVLLSLKGEIPSNAVNLPIMVPLEKLRPYLNLAEKLGKFQNQLIRNAPYSIELNYSGEVFENEKVDIITIGFLKGLLSGIVEGDVTYVNAISTAKERNIGLVESIRRLPSVYSNQISTSIKWKEGISEVSGTVINSKDNRIIEINECHLDLKASGNILLTFHIDQPGIVASVTSVLAKNNINIAEMELGRKKTGGEAIMTIIIDSVLSDETLKKISKIEGIKEVKMLKL
ncbi:MAG: phosphoglycerate dehydrogenase [Candidatus Firestonebacteria bacterium]